MINRNFKSKLVAAILLLSGLALTANVHAQGGATLKFALPNLLQNDQLAITVIDKPLTGLLDFDFVNQNLVLNQDVAPDPVDYFFVTASDADSDEVAYWEFFLDGVTQTYLFNAKHLSVHTDQDGNQSLGIIEIEGNGDAITAQFQVTNVKFTGKDEHIEKVQEIWDAIVDKANETDENGDLKHPDLHDIVDPIVNGDKEIEIKVVSGDTSVIVGSWDLGTIDIEDVNNFPADAPGMHPSEHILHEVVEQWHKQTKKSDYKKAHQLALEAQTIYSGWTYGGQLPTRPGFGNDIIISEQWEKDGTVKVVEVTVRDGGIVGVVTKDVTPPSSGGSGGNGGSGGGQHGPTNPGGGTPPPVGGGF